MTLNTYIVEIINTRTGEAICEQLVEAIDPQDARRLAMTGRDRQTQETGRIYLAE